MTRPGRRSLAGAATLLMVIGATGCAGSDDPSAVVDDSPTTLVDLDDAVAGDIVGLVGDDDRGVVSWLHRTDGTIHEVTLGVDTSSTEFAALEPIVVGSVDIGLDSQQGGLLDQLIVDDGERILTWTTADDNELVLGTLGPDDTAPTVRWSAGRAGGGAIGGTLGVAPDGTVLLGLGRNTGWDADTLVGGAILAFESGLDAEPSVISAGYTNPWAFEALGDGSIWVWDNAAGPDPDDADSDDVERIGRADLTSDRNEMTRSEQPDRAPAEMIQLPDGRLGVCSFLDNELRAYEIVDRPDGQAEAAIERAGTIMPCNVTATVLADGAIVAAAQADDGQTLQILLP